MGYRTLTLTVDGLSAHPQGSQAVERALAAADGIVRVYVSPSIETVYVAYDPRRTTASELVATLARAGFRAGDVKSTEA